MLNKSNLDIAYELISGRGEAVSFKEIWEEVVRVQEYDEAAAARMIGQFYTNLSMDGRFVTLGENVWDLRNRHTFEKVHIDMNDVYRDVETSSDEEVDEEEAEYNKLLDEEDHRDEYDEETDEELNKDSDSDDSEF